jgi:predicted transcriptional regulator of viral defense system
MVDVELISQVSQVGHALATVSTPAITPYELGKLVCLKGRMSDGNSLKHEYKRLIETLTGLGMLTQIADTGAFFLFGRLNATPAEVACCLDPFAYVSHLSAMEHHGLTDRFPRILYLTTPPAVEWRKQADAKMHKDLGEFYEEYKASALPRLTRPKMSSIGHTAIHLQERSHLGAFRLVSGTSLRVATIGRVFLDMLREPRLCGGMQHVLDIYKSEGRRYFRLIVDEVERHGKPIDKVRAGYVLTDLCRIDNPVFLEWEKLAQRGGSRKLDPDTEYSTVYSERWQLSINVPSLTVEGDEVDEL